MPIKRTKYFVLPAVEGSTGANFTDFDLSLGSVSLTGQEVTFVGSALVDAVFVRPGVSIDFVLSGSGSDAVYFPSRYADYSVTLAGTNMTVQRGADSTLEKVVLTKAGTVAISDRLVFSDGTVNSLSLFNSLKAVDPVPLSPPAGETSQAPQFPSPLDASVKAFALGDSGDTFAPSKPGVKMTIVGSLYADTVYIADGGNVDATLLGSGKDIIHFRGNWSDYAKTVAGNYVTFTRSVNGTTETVKVNSGSGGLNDLLVFADGAAGSQAAKVALVAAGTNTAGVALSSLTDFNGALRTPGLGLLPLASALDNLTNLDVSSNIVLTFPEAVTAVSGKVIRIVNVGGAGFRSENTINTLDVAVDSTAQVQISGATVVINPTSDLDFGNDYYISIDAGAFVGASGKLSDAFEGVSSLNFSTVTPGTTSPNLPNISNAAPSFIMGSGGTLTPSYSYLDIEGIGSPAAGAATPIDLSTSNVALVFKDHDPSGPDTNLGYDGVRAGNFNIAVNGFGAGDRIYVDNQSPKANNLGLTNYSNSGTSPTTIQFAGNDLGGFIYLTVANSSAGFSDAAALKAALGNVSYDPIVSDGLAAIAADTEAPVIGTAATLGITENTTRVANLNANEPVTWSIVGATGSVSADARLFKIEGSSTLSFASAPNYEQVGRQPSYSVRVSATDTAGNVSTKDLTVNVTDVNESPTASGSIGAQTAAVGEPFSLSLSGRFIDPDSAATNAGKLTYTISPALPSWLTFSEANLTLSGTPTTSAAAASYTIKATDGGSPALSATQAFSLVVASEVVITGFRVSDGVGSPAIGKSGDSLTFIVQMSEAVTVSTTGGKPPVATFSIDNATTSAQYQSGSGTSQLTFSGPAPAGVSGSFQLTGLSLNNGTIVGSGARPLTTSLLGQTFSGYSVDHVAPTITVPTPIKASENSTTVTTLTASEANVTWALGTSGDASLFQLSGAVLTFRANQDFEQTTRSNSYSVPLVVTDTAGNVTNRTVTVDLQDVNEFKVSSVTDRDSTANFIAENSRVGTPVGVTALARDLDGTNNKVTYKLVTPDGNADYTGGEFRIDSSSGVVSVAGLINYEAGATRTVRIRAFSSDGSQTNSSDGANPDLIATINIGDIAGAQPLILSSAPVISPTTTAISGKTAAGLWVKAFVGSGNAAIASAPVQADSQGNWSMPASALSGLALGSNPVKFVATSTPQSVTPVAELVQSLLYSGAASWTQEALKNPLIRGTVDQALASDGKITHAEAVSIIDAAISAAKTAMPTNTKVGATILADLRTLSTRGDSVFSSPDLTGKESGYLSYVFDKVVNTSGANAFFTGGTTTPTALGNLNADSPIASLEKLRDKWLLGKDLPDPRTQGDTANPNATSASGTYKTFSGVLVAADGFNLTDVQQGNAGTCYLLAAAAFVAETQTYSKTLGANAPSALKPYQNALDQVFTANAGESPTWGVRFFDQYGKANWVTVNNQLVVKNPDDTTALYARPAKTSSGPAELWVPLIEKAYAQANEMGIFGREKSQNAYFTIEGGLAEPIASLIGGGVSIYDSTNQLYKPNFFVTGEPNIAKRLANFTTIMNSGESLFVASFFKAPGEKDTFVSGHAYIAYDDARTIPNNATANIYNPWGPSGPSWLSPFASNLNDLYNNQSTLLAFHSPTIPTWSTDGWKLNAAKKAASAAPVPVASQLREASSSSNSNASPNATVGELSSSATFLSIGPGVASAFSDNGTANTADDRQGVYTLSATQQGTRIVYLEKTSQSGGADLIALKGAITGATSAQQFHVAVQNALSSNVEVRFGLKLPGAADITGDTRPETGVTVALKYPFAVGSLPANTAMITLAPLKDVGEIESAKSANGAAVGVRDTMLSSVGHAVSFDAATGAVLYLDPKGHWMAGQTGKPVFSAGGGYSEFYKYLTYDANGESTPDKINNDSLEVSAQHIQSIIVDNLVVGYELLVKSNENPDDFFVLYFDGSGALVSSEYLSDTEILEAEVEYGFDVNDNGSVAFLEGENFVSQDVFLAEGTGGAPDLYADAYGDLVLVGSNGSKLPIKYQSVPLNTYDFDEEIELSAVMVDSSNPQQLLVFILGADDELAAVKVGASSGEIVLVNGEIDFVAITPAMEAELERLSGIDLGRDGDTAALSPLITGDASDNFFDTAGDGTSDRFKDSSGDDIYFAGEGDDLLLGILFEERNFGSRGANTFFGGEGNDRMAGLGDGDVFFGGTGHDAVWINGASTAYQILPATAGQLAFAQEIAAGFDEPVPTGGHTIREIASGAVSFVWDVEIVEFALDGLIGPLQQTTQLP